MVDSRTIERENNRVPTDLTGHAEIRSWLDEKAKFFPKSGRAQIADRLSRQRSDSDIGGLEPDLSPDRGFYYNPEAGRWQGEGGFVSGDLPEGATYDFNQDQWRGPNGQFISGPKVE
jgi:hypothetical protein